MMLKVKNMYSDGKARPGIIHQTSTQENPHVFLLHRHYELARLADNHSYLCSAERDTILTSLEQYKAQKITIYMTRIIQSAVSLRHNLLPLNERPMRPHN